MQTIIRKVNISRDGPVTYSTRLQERQARFESRALLQGPDLSLLVFCAALVISNALQSLVSILAWAGESGSQLRAQIPTRIARASRRIGIILYRARSLPSDNDSQCMRISKRNGRDAEDVHVLRSHRRLG